MILFYFKMIFCLSYWHVWFLTYFDNEIQSRHFANTRSPRANTCKLVHSAFWIFMITLTFKTYQNIHTCFPKQITLYKGVQFTWLLKEHCQNFMNLLEEACLTIHQTRSLSLGSTSWLWSYAKILHNANCQWNASTINLL